MPHARIILAHVLLGSAVWAGCADSHGGAGDGGPSSPDAPSPIADAGPGPDSGPGRDAAPIGTCEAADVSVLRCPAALCDALPRWYWDGERCFEVDCGACTGPDCGAGVESRERCELEHGACAPERCRDTGGTWMFWAEECEHRICGNPSLADCEVGVPVCDCGPYRVFDDVRGCVEPDPACGRLPERSREALCRATGGSWEGICCDTVCGAFCPLACASPACHCGDTQIFDEERGCIEATQCFDRRPGETCGRPRQRCADLRTECVTPCDGPGCEPTCEYPVCPFR